MPTKSRKFIDKKKATTFYLVHRSQQDPLQADDEAPSRVLISDDQIAYAQKQERLAACGIFCDESDDYDYEQHLKDLDDLNHVTPDTDFIRIGERAKKKLNLPDVVFPSKDEEKIGLLGLAAPVSGPRLDWDPDVLATLDSDFSESDPEGVLEDDFMVLANQSGEDFSGDEYMDKGTNCERSIVEERKEQWLREQLYAGPLDGMSSSQDGHLTLPHASIDHQLTHNSDSDEDDGDDVDSDGDHDEFGSLPDLAEEETKSRFTNYSMSSSIIRRNEGLTMLDEKFEKVYAAYDEEDLGALDDEDIDGKVTTSGPLMESLLREFEAQQFATEEEKNQFKVGEMEMVSDESSDEEIIKMGIEERADQKWDCESIISTYSNLYNHPKFIEETWKKHPERIQLTKRLGIPTDSLPQKGLTRKQLEQLTREQHQLPTSAPVRSKYETAEERRARKALVKEGRRERRVEKKSTKMAFKAEEAEQKKQIISIKSSQGVKLL